MAQYTCIKPTCNTTYNSEDLEAYYCPSCTEENKAIAAEIDAKVKARPRREAKSEYQLAKEQGNIKKEPNGTEVIVLRG